MTGLFRLRPSSFHVWQALLRSHARGACKIGALHHNHYHQSSAKTDMSSLNELNGSAEHLKFFLPLSWKLGICNGKNRGYTGTL